MLGTLHLARSESAVRPLAALYIGLTFVFGASGCGSHGAKSASVPPGAVSGTLDKDCGFGGCTSTVAEDQLSATNVWCRWRGADVLVHLHLVNGANAHVTARIVPRYEIEDGGVHGDSFGSDRAVEVNAAASRIVTLDAGHPEGVPNGTSISKCDPRLLDADITNP